MKASVALLVLGCFMVADEKPLTDEPSSKFKVTTRRKNDRVVAQIFKNKAIFVVKSPVGISQSTIERQEDWPSVVVLRLHLKGLEHFRASNGTVTLEAAVSSQEKGPKGRVWKDGKENDLLDQNSPFWTEIRIASGDGAVAKEIPLKGGYFEMTLPKAFFDANPKSITLNWIDFYRK